MIRWSLIIVVLLQIWRVNATYEAKENCEVLVQIDSGPVCGKVLIAENATKYNSFRGLPYAKPPIGRKRFGRPEPPEKWVKPLQAIMEGPACLQRDFFYGNLPVQIQGQSENCLYANVHVPVSDEHNCAENMTVNKTGLPILVVVHGGTFTCGSGNSDIHGPEYFMYKKKAIVVTFNYRLNVLGFLYLNTSKVPGNDGLRDMVLLLEWVQRNAQAFGGNPNDVTLMGQGTGATAVHLLSLSKATEGLFHRRIMLSATAIPSYFSTSPTYAKYVSELFLETVGINSTDPDEIYEQLISMPINKIMYANSQVQYELGITTFTPVVENYDYADVVKVLDDEPIQLIGEGRGKQYPTLVSYTNNEMDLLRWILIFLNFLDRLKTSPQAIMSPRFIYSLPTDELMNLTSKVHQRCFNGSEPTLDQVIVCLSDSFIKYSIMKFVEWQAALEGAAPVYLSEFSYNGQFNAIKEGLSIDYESACHVEDQTYLLKVNTLLGKYVSFPPTTKDDQMKDWMSTIVHNFIYCSNPTCLNDTVSQWPSVKVNKTLYNVNDEPMVYKVRELPDEIRSIVEFFDTIDAESKELSTKLNSSLF